MACGSRSTRPSTRHPRARRSPPSASWCTTRASRPISPIAASAPPTLQTRSRAARSSSAHTASRSRSTSRSRARRASRSSTPPAPGCSRARRPPGSWRRPATRCASSATRTIPRSRAFARMPATSTWWWTTWTDPPGSGFRAPRRSGCFPSRRSCPQSWRSSPPSACAAPTTCVSSTRCARSR